MNILLLEDDADDEALALRTLRGTGLPLRVAVARDGEEAIRALDDRPAPDLVISDYKLPLLDGPEILRRVRADERLRRVPFVVLSSSDDEGDVRRCRALGADDYVVKPVDAAEYRRVVSDLARRWAA